MAVFPEQAICRLDSVVYYTLIDHDYVCFQIKQVSHGSEAIIDYQRSRTK